MNVGGETTERFTFTVDWGDVSIGLNSIIKKVRDDMGLKNVMVMLPFFAVAVGLLFFDRRKVAVAPFNLRQTFRDLIDREIRLSAPHHPGEIVAPMACLPAARGKEVLRGRN